MIGLNKERVIEKGGKWLEERIAGCGKIVLSGRVDEMFPNEATGERTIIIDGDSVTELSNQLVHEDGLGDFLIAVPESGVDLMIDNDGWLSRSISGGYITAFLWREIVLNKLNENGVAVMEPVEEVMVMSLMEWMDKIISKGMRFLYKFEAIGDESRFYRLIVWKNPKMEIEANDVMVANYSLMAAQMGLYEDDDSITPEESLKLQPIDDNGSISLFVSSYFGGVEFESGVRLLPWEKVLYLSYLDLSKFGGHRTVAKELGCVKEILRQRRDIKYVFSLTWLGGWMQKLGMKRSRLLVDARAVRCELEAINQQVFSYLTGDNRTSMGDRSVRAMMEKGIKYEEIAYWYCRAKDFGGKFIK